MAHACNPSTLGGRDRWITRSGVRDQTGQRGETQSLLKIQKISWAWWREPVILAIWEAEAGESLEPGRWRLQSRDHATALQPRQQQQNSISKKKKSYLLGTLLIN